MAPTPVISDVYSGISKLTRTWLWAAEVVDFVGLQVVEELHQIYRVREIAVMEEKPDAVTMGVLIEVIDAAGIEGARSPDDPVDFVPLFEQQIGQIGAILAGDAGN